MLQFFIITNIWDISTGELRDDFFFGELNPMKKGREQLT